MLPSYDLCTVYSSKLNVYVSRQTYDRSSIPALVCTIRELLDLYPYTTVIIAATVRNDKTYDAFIKACCEVNIPTHHIL